MEPVTIGLIASAISSIIQGGTNVYAAGEAGEIEEEDIKYQRGQAAADRREAKKQAKQSQSNWEKEFAQSLRAYADSLALSNERLAMDKETQAFNIRTGTSQSRMNLRQANIALAEMLNKSKFRRAIGKSKLIGSPQVKPAIAATSAAAGTGQLYGGA